MFPLRKMEIVGWVLYTLIVVFSNFSGLAGGLPLVIIIAMFNFNMKASIPLSNTNIMFAAFIRILMNCKDPHPLRKKGTILDYSIVTMMFPMITVGSAISSFVSPAVPDIYILIGYSVIVFGIVIFSIFRLIALIKKESALSKPKVETPTPIQKNFAESSNDPNPKKDSNSPRNGDCSKIEFVEKDKKGDKLEFPDDNDKITFKLLCCTRKYTKKELREKMEDEESTIV
jgi:hypothetical protein